MKITRQALDRELDISGSSIEDAEAVKLMAAAVGRRAARLAAVAIGATVIRSERLGHIATVENPTGGDDTPPDEEDIIEAGEPLAFEIIPPRSHQRQPSYSKRGPDIKKLRIKVHGEDMRYVMTTPDVQMNELPIFPKYVEKLERSGRKI